MRNFLNTVFFALIILAFVIFALSNSQSIQLNFLGIVFSPVHISLLVLIPFLAGVVIGSFLDLTERLSLRREVKRLKRELMELEEKSQESQTQD